jgi:hypothetical protein
MFFSVNIIMVLHAAGYFTKGSKPSTKEGQLIYAIVLAKSHL